MNKTIITTTDFSKKSYTKPEMKVFEIEQAELICQSPDPNGRPTETDPMETLYD